MDYYYGTGGGTEGQILRLITHLNKDEYRPTLAVLRATEYIKLNSSKMPCPVNVLQMDKMLSLFTLIKLFKFSLFLRREKVSVVHIYFNDSSIIAPFFCWLGGSKVIVSRRDMGIWYTPKLLKIIKTVNRFVDLIIANSQAVAKYTASHEKYSDKKIKVIYNGYDYASSNEDNLLDIRKELGVSSGSLLVGIVANLSQVKRHKDLIMAFKDIVKRNNNAHLLIIGMGRLDSDLKHLAASLDISDNVHFLGSIKDVIPIVKQLNVGVLCSESEGFSNSIMEYMACGIPTVCTNVGGNPEIVNENENGFLVEPGDVTALSKKISQLLEDKELSKQMSNSARETIQKFSLDNMIYSHSVVYKNLLEEEC